MFSKLKMKYKFMMVILLPTVVLLGFISKFLLDDIHNVQNLKKATVITNISDQIRTTVGALVEEESYSFLDLEGLIAGNKAALSQARNTTDQAIQALTNIISKADVSVNGQSVAQIFETTMNELKSINITRRQLDNRTISHEDLHHYFETVAKLLIQGVARIADHEDNAVIARSIYVNMFLAHEALDVTDERSLLYIVFSNNKVTQSQYSELIHYISSQEAFQQAFFDVSTPEQDAIHQNMLNIPDIREADQLRQLVVDNPNSDNFGVDPQTWWKKQSEKIYAFEKIGKSILEVNIQHANELINKYQNNLYWTVAFLLGTMVITFIMVVYSFRSLTEKLQEEINTLATSGNEISTSISETSAGTAETASAVTETTTTVEELKQTAEVAAESASNVSEVSEEALQVLRASEDALESTIRGMTNIQEGMETISESIIKLSEHSQTIGEIIDTVNDLAEQSHLLAVNAAIEAAKAGDQGKGFAVVAQEVRSLAEQSKQATVQIRNILNDIQNSTSAAVMATEQGSKAVAVGMSQSGKTNESIRSIYKGIEKVAEAASQIAVTSQQQLVGVEQVTIAMANIRESTGQQVEHMRTIENGMVGLTEVGNSLQKLIEEYTLIKK